MTSVFACFASTIISIPLFHIFNMVGEDGYDIHRSS